jgi:hypothetical protein
MKKNIKTTDELELFVNKLIGEKQVVEVFELPEGMGFEVQWIEHKSYTAQDGRTFPDEIWTTKEGEMKLVQDLEPEHLRNVLRMILRQERESRKSLEGILEQIVDEWSTKIDDEEEEPQPQPTHTLH